MFELYNQNPSTFCKEVRQVVDPIIKEVLSLSIDLKRHRLVNYQMLTGGKRLRPALTIASCLACNGAVQDALYPAAGLEILHNCSLIYDDIIDHSDLRRGKATVWCRFGKSIAQCVGLDYAAAIFQAASRSHYPLEISEIFADTLKAVVEGEIRDIVLEQWGRDDEKYVVDHRCLIATQEDYLQMVTQKTASLMQASCEVGAICAGARKDRREALREYGFNLGIAFQIRDDILDIFGEEQEFGKTIGKDIEGRKLGNIVVLYSLEEVDSSREQGELSAILRKNHIEPRDIETAVTLIDKTRAREKSLLLEKEYLDKAKRSLNGLAKNKWNDLLVRIADFVVGRNR
jgi:geranylgeranyl diphosphate synthase type I